VIWYLKGTTYFRIFCRKGGNSEIVALYWQWLCWGFGRYKEYFRLCVSNGFRRVCWSSKKQPVVRISTAEAEFIAAASCSCQAVWLKRVLGILDQTRKTTVIHCDGSSAIKLLLVFLYFIYLSEFRTVVCLSCNSGLFYFRFSIF